MTDQHVACELCAPPEPTTSAASVARPRVLVIDDEEAIRSALGRALAAEGLVTDLADTAADGLSRARAEVYDLVILDLLMPGTDGSAVPARGTAPARTCRRRPRAAAPPASAQRTERPQTPAATSAIPVTPAPAPGATEPQRCHIVTVITATM